jgi:Family of unknown function (DUF6515)
VKTIVVALLMIVSFAAHAQHREFARERFHTPHWVFDDRFHHDHFYPALGYSVAALPAGNLALNFRGGRFWFHSGVWFQQSGAGFVVVRPPVGIVVPVLPPAYATVWVGGAPYYYANDVYYSAAPGGYVVADPPAAEGAAPQAQAANWYYCDSAKAYYPYVSECKEGWRQVPATPPR